MYEKPTITQLTKAEAAYLLYEAFAAPPVRRSKSTPVKMPMHNRGALTIQANRVPAA